MSDKKTLEELKEDHGMYIFGTPKNSKGVEKDGTEYDQGFVTEIGRVNYEIQEDGSYVVEISEIDGKRVLSLDLLSGWFYDPSKEYFDLNIAGIKLLD